MEGSPLEAASFGAIADFDAYLKAAIGRGEDEACERFKVEANAKNKRGGDRRSKDAKSIVTATIDSQSTRAKDNGVGLNTQRLLDALASKRPDLLEKVDAGELKPKTAARMAGIVKEKTALEQLRQWWEKATAKERRTFLAEVQQ